MHIFVQVTSALAVSRSSKATLLLTSLKMLWSTQDPADTCSSCIEDRFVKKHISCGQTWECVSIFHLHRFWVQCEFSCSIRFQGLRGFKASSTFADTSLSSMSGDYIGLVAIGLHWPKRATGKLRDSLLRLFVFILGCIADVALIDCDFCNTVAQGWVKVERVAALQFCCESLLVRHSFVKSWKRS